MPANVTKMTREEKQDLLKKVLPGTKRVQVINGKGQTTYKAVGDVDLDVDDIPFLDTGRPICVRGNQGRPKGRRVGALKPVTDELQNLQYQRDDHIGSSPILKKIRKNQIDETLIDKVLEALAEEAESLEFDRLEAQTRGQETSTLAMRRSRVLKTIADISIRKESLARKNEEGGIDLDSKSYAALFAFTLETFKEAMVRAYVRDEQVETVFTHITRLVSEEGWKEEAKAKMRNK